ncbi:glycerol-3-phosphate dehydrogenase [Algirhabdus cladophorae]|uniref:glycerol-3-phosphate dehydrogenase n=1 Tax=Algirhabdus cladophorae TaxID=3377108 RepID=UPI003B84A639
MNNATNPLDLFIIGGGINGTGVARDAAGRGMSVALAEMGDLGGATSSASTKLFHGGLRYLEFFEFNLVRKALIEREVLLSAMPHISWPMRFVLPYHKDMRFDTETPTSQVLTRVMPWMRGRRPKWLIRLGLFLYDSLGGRKILPATTRLDLTQGPEGAVLNRKFQNAFEYSDCWVEDSRLVVLNAVDAQNRGAQILARTKVVSALRDGDLWRIETLGPQGGAVHFAKALINAGGPWVEDVIRGVARLNATEGVRLVRGSHIVTDKLFDHDKAYFFQGEDGRIIFAIPYETDFTLIGTTDADHDDVTVKPKCTDAERDYLIDFINTYFAKDISAKDVVWTYSGVRPLYDDGAKSATAATRDYVLTLNDDGAPLLNIFGGKITTYRKLSEQVLSKIGPFFPHMTGDWTAGVALPGGDFPVADVPKLIQRLAQDYPFLDGFWAKRLIRAYGTLAWDVLGQATQASDLGKAFGASLTAREVQWLMDHEFVHSADDVLWRRSKLGLRLTSAQACAVADWIDGQIKKTA